MAVAARVAGAAWCGAGVEKTMMNRSAVAILLLVAPALYAQKRTQEGPAKNDPPFFAKGAKEDRSSVRTVRGVVRGPKDTPVSGALVTLTDKETKRSQQLITGEDGNFQFESCKKSVDYEFKAEYRGAKSEVKTLSSYNPSAQPFLELRLGAPKGSESDGKQEQGAKR
jgi:hypothetical protein